MAQALLVSGLDVEPEIMVLMSLDGLASGFLGLRSLVLKSPDGRRMWLVPFLRLSFESDWNRSRTQQSKSGKQK